MESRRIFNYDDLKKTKIVNGTRDMFNNSITATGCLFYKLIDNKVFVLLVKYADKNWPLLDDFGGKIMMNDNSVLNAAIRKTTSETNNIINDEIIADIICDNNYEMFYNKKSKYLVHLIKVNSDFMVDTSIFGDIEQCDKIKRTVNWYEFGQVKNKIAYRLSLNEKLHVYLNGLEN